MRNLKKLLAVIVAICVLATFTVPAFAAETTKTDAEICADLSILKGSGDGVTAEYLATGTTRIQAAILYLRLLGLEDEAKAETSTDNFEDAADMSWAEGKAILAYLKKNPSLGWQGDTINFGAANPATAQMLYKVMLTALGYVQGVDFEYANAITFAGTVGLTAIASVTELTNDDVAKAIVEALKAKIKDGTKTLAEKLVADGVITEAAAIAAGLIAEDVTAVATVTGAKIFTVTFNKAVDTTKATFAVKKGSVTMAVSKSAWNDEKTVATITMVSPLTDGDYVITVGGLDLAVTDYTVTAVASKVASIEIASDVAPKTATSAAAVTFSYAVKNQYGEKITATTNLTWTASTGAITVDQANGIGTVTFASEQLKDTTFVVTAIESSTGVYATKVLKVGDVAKVAKINVLGLYNADNKTLYTNSTFTNFYVKVEAFDQYNNKVGIAALNDATQTTVVPSNTAIVNKGAFVVVDSTTALQLAAGSGTAGTAVINFISNITGQSSSATITVTKAAALDNLAISVPADLAVKEEVVKIPFTAQDQYGVELSETVKGALTSADVTITCTDPAATLAFSYNYETKLAELKLDLTNDAVTTGSKIIMAVTKTGKVSQITVDVKAVATPSTVSSVKDTVATKLNVGAISKLAESNIVVVDQYGRAMTTDATWFGTYKLAIATGTPEKVTLSTDGGATTASALEITTNDGFVQLVGVATGSSTISVSVKKVSDNTVIANSTFEFTAEAVAKSVITEYVVEAPETLYVGDVAGGHAKDFNVYGKTASGVKVALAASDFIASSNLGIDFTTAGKIDAYSVNTAGWAANTDKTAAIVVIISTANGPQSVTKSITVSNKAPALATISVDATEYFDLSDADDIADIKAEFTGKDQYGIAITMVITNIMVTDVSGVTVTGNGGTAPVIVDATAGDSFQVTIITDNGLTKSTNVVIVP